MSTQNKFAGHYTVKRYCLSYDGSPFVDETIFAAYAILTDKHIISFARMEEGPFGYAGPYTFDDKKFKIKIECCIAPDLEGQTFDWRYEWLSENELKLSGTEISTGRQFEIYSVRTAK